MVRCFTTSTPPPSRCPCAASLALITLLGISIGIDQVDQRSDETARADIALVGLKDSLAEAAGFSFMRFAYNLGNFLRTLAMPAEIMPWPLTGLREKLIKIGAKVASRGRYVTFQMAEFAVPRQMFQDILRLVARLRALPAPA